MNEQLIKPPQLMPGDTIGIVSPSSPTAAACPGRLQRGIDTIRQMGFQVIVGKNARRRTGHTAGSIQERLDDLHEMFANPEVKAIIATIGGLNSHQLLEELDYELIRRNPKILMGYSDITALLTVIHHRTKLVTFMGPAVLPQFGEYGGLLPYTRDAVERVLMNSGVIGTIPASDAWIDEQLRWDVEDSRPRVTRPNSGVKVLKRGEARGPILAANMGVLLLTAGTPYFPDVEGRILCLEDDESETPGTIDRYLTQLRHMGVFDRIRALVVGRFHPRVGFSPEDSLEDVLLQATRGYQFPIVYDADFGHTDPMMVLPLGVEAHLTAGDQATFTIVESAVCGRN
jgi:muramoyltetrapeptide carboxypeptidase